MAVIASEKIVNLDLGTSRDTKTSCVVSGRVMVGSGRETACSATEITLSSAQITTTVAVDVGEAVVRHFRGGIAVQFIEPIAPDCFDERVRP